MQRLSHQSDVVGLRKQIFPKVPPPIAKFMKRDRCMFANVCKKLDEVVDLFYCREIEIVLGQMLIDETAM